MCDVEMVEKESDRVSDQEQAGEFEKKKGRPKTTTITHAL